VTDNLYEYCPQCSDIMEYDYDLERWYCRHCPITVCDCGMGDASLPEIHAKDCVVQTTADPPASGGR